MAIHPALLESLRESLLGAFDDPVFAMDLDGRVTYATPAVALWTGKLFDANAPYAFAGMLPAAESNRFQSALKRITDAKTDHVTLDMRLTPADAGEQGATPVELKLIAISGSNGKATQIVGRIRDVSAEIANEAAANLQSTHLLGLVENVADGCVIETADGIVEMVNAAFCDLFGIKAAPQSLIGTDCRALFETASAATKNQSGPRYTTLEAHDVSSEEFGLGTSTVTHKTLPVDGHDEGVAGRLHVFHAVGKTAKGGKANASKSAEQEEKSAFSATEALQVSLIEEIARNLAIAVEGAGSAIHRAEQLELPGQVLEHFRRVESSARAALTATAGLADFGKLESSDIALSHTPFKLRESVAGLLETLMPQFEERGVRIKLRLEQDVPEHLIGDGARLMLAIRNLIECELAHLERDSKITFTVEPEYAANKTVHLSFTVEHTHAKGSTRTKATSTTGLMQLSLVRQITRALGAQSGTQAGGQASSKLNVRERKDGVAYQFAASFTVDDATDARNRPTYFTLTGMPVLIVSASTDERKRLADLVRTWRMHPREADNASMALHLLNRMAAEDQAIPLVITSNQLPVQDGFLLAFRIKQQESLNGTMIVMLAQDGKPGDAMACRENGISAYLRQPIRPDQLNDAINAVMGTGDDAESTQTLVTRHSLREAKVGTVLIVDGNREQGKLAAQILKRKEYRVVTVESAEEAFANLSQDIFDAVVVDGTTPGFDAASSAAAQLKSHIGIDRDVPIIAAQSDYGKADAGYSGVITKPYDKDALLEKIRAVIPDKVVVP
jgi:CheY-like chemotaxis protein/PAS domain-containing protein